MLQSGGWGHLRVPEEECTRSAVSPVVCSKIRCHPFLLARSQPPFHLGVHQLLCSLHTCTKLKVPLVFSEQDTMKEPLSFWPFTPQNGFTSIQWRMKSAEFSDNGPSWQIGHWNILEVCQKVRWNFRSLKLPISMTHCLFRLNKPPLNLRCCFWILEVPSWWERFRCRFPYVIALIQSLLF